MKNQYFGDENDYKKYGLIRILSHDGEIRTAICWMLTEDNSKNDGKFTDYLNKPDKWRVFDPQLFDSLKNCFAKPENRNVSWAKTTNIIKSAIFYSKMLTDNALERQQYFEQFLSIATAYELVFFDPDNGLEVKSKPYGRKGSHKYLYWQELLSTFRAGHSVLLYQHFPRKKRAVFINNLAKVLSLRTGTPEIISFRTRSVVFMLIPQSYHLDHFRQCIESVTKVWSTKIEVCYHL